MKRIFCILLVPVFLAIISSAAEGSIVVDTPTPTGSWQADCTVTPPSTTIDQICLTIVSGSWGDIGKGLSGISTLPTGWTETVDSTTECWAQGRETDTLNFTCTYLNGVDTPQCVFYCADYENGKCVEYDECSINSYGRCTYTSCPTSGAPSPTDDQPPVPEPATLIIWGVGAALAGTAAARRRKQPRGRWSAKNRQAIQELIEGKLRV